MMKFRNKWPFERLDWSFSCGKKGDRLWWGKFVGDFKNTYLLSVHTVEHADYPGVKTLHIILGPFRVILAKLP